MELTYNTQRTKIHCLEVEQSVPVKADDKAARNLDESSDDSDEYYEAESDTDDKRATLKSQEKNAPKPK